MKKVVIILLGVLFISCLFVSEVNSQSTVEKVVDKVTNAVTAKDAILHCRCKKGGCYGGNALSFRANCTNFEHGEGDCTKSNNCPK